MMVETFPIYIDEFKCLADKCPDTCCAGWEVVIDSDTALKYMREKGKVGRSLRRRMMINRNHDCVFYSSDNKCPYLCSDGLCDIYKEKGKDFLCRTCRDFPRQVSYFGSRSEVGLSLSCPEAARIIMSQTEPIEFDYRSTTERIVPSDFSSDAFVTLRFARRYMFYLLKDRRKSVEERFCGVIELCRRIDECMKNGDYDKARMKVTRYKPSFSSFKLKKIKGRKAVAKFIHDHKKIETTTPERKELFKSLKGFSGNYPNQQELENIASYLIFKYIILAAYDENLETKIKFCAMMLIMIKMLCSDVEDKNERIKLVQQYSKEVEHSDRNMKFFSKVAETCDYYDYNSFINVLLTKEIKL